MDLQLLFKSAKAFILTKSQRSNADSETDFAWLNTLSPNPNGLKTLAEVPKGLGRSEKFSSKSRILSVLASLNFLSGESPEKSPVKNSPDFGDQSSASPISVGHIFQKKNLSAYSPGVVRIRAKDLQLQAKTQENRLATTPQPLHSSREQPSDSKANSANSKSSLFSVSSRNVGVRAASVIREKHLMSWTRTRPKANANTNPNPNTKTNLESFKFPNKTVGYSRIPENCNSRLSILKLGREDKSQNEILKYIGGFTQGLREGPAEIEYKNGDKFQGFLKKEKKTGEGSYFYSKFKMKFKGEYLEDLPHGTGSLKFESGESFKLNFKDGKVSDGFGQARYKDGAVYEGNLVNARRSGSGRMEYNNEAVYIGTWQNDQRSGWGTISLNSCFWFQGKFNSDFTEGPGLLLLDLSESSKLKESQLKDDPFFNIIQSALKSYQVPESSLLESSTLFVSLTSSNAAGVLQKTLNDGKFLAGKLNGAGLARYSDFGSYIGNFLEGKKSGHGKMVYKDPKHSVPYFPEYEGVYIGLFKDDKRHGFGTMTWPDGLTYIGNFNCDRRHCVQGKLVFKNGDIFEGSWIDNKMEGNFTLFKKHMTVNTQFFAGTISSKASIKYKDGKQYEGDIQALVPHGTGQMKWPTGKSYFGHFLNGVIDGVGRLVYQNGDIYEGEFENGQRSGKGSILISESQTKYEGSWSDDKLQENIN